MWMYIYSCISFILKSSFTTLFSSKETCESTQFPFWRPNNLQVLVFIVTWHHQIEWTRECEEISPSIKYPYQVRSAHICRTLNVKVHLVEDGKVLSRPHLSFRGRVHGYWMMLSLTLSPYLTIKGQVSHKMSKVKATFVSVMENSGFRCSITFTCKTRVMNRRHYKYNA